MILNLHFKKSSALSTTELGLFFLDTFVPLSNLFLLNVLLCICVSIGQWLIPFKLPFEMSFSCDYIPLWISILRSSYDCQSVSRVYLIIMFIPDLLACLCTPTIRDWDKTGVLPKIRKMESHSHWNANLCTMTSESRAPYCSLTARILWL